MDRPVRIGLLGAGAVAQTAHLPAFRRLRNAELVAICDSEGGKLRALRERTGVVHATTSLDEMLALDELDAVDICLPSNQHAAAAVRCLEAGKHVLCEKPLGLTAREVEDVLAARDRSGKHVLVGMNNRYRDDSILLRRFIQDGQLGEVFRARAGWLKRRTKVKPGAWQYAAAMSGGGVVMDLGIQLAQQLALGHPDFFYRVIHFQQVVARKPEGLEQNRRRHLSPAVDPDVQDVARIELEIQP